MAPFLSVFVGGTVGVLTGMYSIALQGRTVLKPHISYGIYLAAGGFLGFKYYEFRQFESQLVERRHKLLVEKREQRLAAAAAATASATESQD